MELGAEISIKVKKIIKKQLQTLGCYVDDELPEYIMVMVANKRTEIQMIEDLNLFLGDETEKFVSWLLLVLARIEKAMEVPGIDELLDENAKETKKVKKHQSEDDTTPKVKKKIKEEKGKRKFKEIPDTETNNDEETKDKQKVELDKKRKQEEENELRKKEKEKKSERSRSRSIEKKRIARKSRSRERSPSHDKHRRRNSSRRSRSRSLKRRSRSRSQNRRRRSRSRNRRSRSRSRNRRSRSVGRRRHSRSQSRSRQGQSREQTQRKSRSKSREKPVEKRKSESEKNEDDIREEAQAEAKRIESRKELPKNPMEFVKQIANDINKKLMLPEEIEQMEAMKKSADDESINLKKEANSDVVDKGNISLQAVTQYGEVDKHERRENTRSRSNSGSRERFDKTASEKNTSKSRYQSRRSPVRHRRNSRDRSPRSRRERSRSRRRESVRGRHSRSPVSSHRKRETKEKSPRSRKSRSRSGSRSRQRRNSDIRNRRDRKSRSRSQDRAQRREYSRRKSREDENRRDGKSRSEAMTSSGNKDVEEESNSQQQDDKTSDQKTKSNVSSQVKVHTDFRRRPSLSKKRQASDVLLKRAVTDAVKGNSYSERKDEGKENEVGYEENVDSLHRGASTGSDHNERTTDKRIIQFDRDGSRMPTITLVNYQSDTRVSPEKHRKVNNNNRNKRSENKEVSDEEVELRKGLLQDMSRVDARYAILKSRLDHETATRDGKTKTETNNRHKPLERRHRSKDKETKYIGSMVADLEEDRKRKDKIRQRGKRQERNLVRKRQHSNSSDDKEYHAKRADVLKTETERIKQQEVLRSNTTEGDVTDLRNLLQNKKQTSANFSSDDEDDLAQKLREKIKEEKHKRLFGQLKSDEREKLKREREELRDKLKMKKLEKRKERSQVDKQNLNESNKNDDVMQEIQEEWVESHNIEYVHPQYDMEQDDVIDEEKPAEDNSSEHQPEDTNEPVDLESREKQSANDSSKQLPRDDFSHELDQQSDVEEKAAKEEENAEVSRHSSEKDEQVSETNQQQSSLNEQPEIGDEGNEDDDAIEEMQDERTIVTKDVDIAPEEEDDEQEFVQPAEEKTESSEKQKRKSSIRKSKHKSSRRRRTRHEFVVTLNGGSKEISIKTDMHTSSRRSKSPKSSGRVDNSNVSNRKRSSSLSDSNEDLHEKQIDEEKSHKLKHHRRRRHSSSRHRRSSSSNQKTDNLSAVDREIILAEKKLKTQKILRKSLEKVQKVSAVYDLNPINKGGTKAFINPHFQRAPTAVASAQLVNNPSETKSSDENLINPLLGGNISLQNPLVEAGFVDVKQTQDAVRQHKQTDVNQTQSASKTVSASLDSSLDSPKQTSPVMKTFDTSSLKQERCVFWPACNKPNCTFVHPTQPCKTFPNCTFGQRCLFVHPPCKFNERCENPDCIYTHDVTSSTQHTFASSSVPICKFSQNCTNKDCPFRHPINKPCKFGSSCTNNECLYLHDNDIQHKWVAAKSISDRKFAVDDVLVLQTPVTITLSKNEV